MSENELDLLIIQMVKDDVHCMQSAIRDSGMTSCDSINKWKSYKVTQQKGFMGHAAASHFTINKP